MHYRLSESAQKTRRVACVNTRCSDVVGDDCAGADDDIVTNGDREDGSICSDTHKIAKFSFDPEAPFLCRAPINEAIIDKHRTVRDEGVVADRDELADK